MERIGELGTTLAVTSNRNTLRRNVYYRRCFPPKRWFLQKAHRVTSQKTDVIIYSHRCEHLKSYI
jgi:hypothetical protein